MKNSTTTRLLAFSLMLVVTLLPFAGCNSKPSKTQEEIEAESIEQREQAMQERREADGR